jgi:ribosomal protein L31
MPQHHLHLHKPYIRAVMTNGASFWTRLYGPSHVFEMEACIATHPLYNPNLEQKSVKATGRLARFQMMYGDDADNAYSYGTGDGSDDIDADDEMPALDDE